MGAGDADTVFLTLTFSGDMSKKIRGRVQNSAEKKEGLLATYSRGRRGAPVDGKIR